MSLTGVLFKTRIRAAVFAVAVMAAASAGVLVGGQLITSPAISISPDVALAGNTVHIQITPPGIGLKGSFYQLTGLSYWPAGDHASRSNISFTSASQAELTVWSPGEYTISASYTNGGSGGTVTGGLTILPSNFTAGALRYGSGATYTSDNGSMAIVNPYGIYAIPLTEFGVSTSVSIIAVHFSMNTTLVSNVSEGPFPYGVTSSTLEAYALNSTMRVEGNGYVNALVAGAGLNLSAGLNIEASSTQFSDVKSRSLLHQESNLSSTLSISYLGRTFSFTNNTTLNDNALTLNLSLISSVLTSSFPGNSSFSMPQQQRELYSRSLPENIEMNLSGQVNGYEWVTGNYTPSLNNSALEVIFPSLPGNTTLWETLNSTTAFPTSFRLSEQSTLNDTTTRFSASFVRTAISLGGVAVASAAMAHAHMAASGYSPAPAAPCNHDAVLQMKLAFEAPVSDFVIHRVPS